MSDTSGQEPPQKHPGGDHPHGQAPGGQPSGGYPPPYGQAPGGYPPPYGQAPGGYYAPPPLGEHDARTWASAAHWGALVAAVVTSGSLGFAVPLIIWLVYRERSWLVGDQAKESLNFQITLVIAVIVGVITSFILIGVFLLIATGILALVFGIQGAIRASRGEPYRYPICIRFVR